MYVSQFLLLSVKHIIYYIKKKSEYNIRTGQGEGIITENRQNKGSNPSLLHKYFK
ncbi:MAG: hypothetical protein K0R54_659 [Clostridiaceae bacterium]|jgi:hypothetical protein|nr:hypothetical protein [Clostridiaceae bacterium]